MNCRAYSFSSSTVRGSRDKALVRPYQHETSVARICFQGKVYDSRHTGTGIHDFGGAAFRVGISECPGEDGRDVPETACIDEVRAGFDDIAESLDGP